MWKAKMMFDPMLLIMLLTLLLRPRTIDEIPMTTATPMTMPSTVRPERSLLLRMVASAIEMISPNSLRPTMGVLSSQFSVLSSQFSVLSSQFSVLSSQFSVLSSQFSVLSSEFSVLSSQFSVLSSQFSVLSSQFSVLGDR